VRAKECRRLKVVFPGMGNAGSRFGSLDSLVNSNHIMFACPFKLLQFFSFLDLFLRTCFCYVMFSIGVRALEIAREQLVHGLFRGL
jgi:hypothetical protein